MKNLKTILFTLAALTIFSVAAQAQDPQGKRKTVKKATTHEASAEEVVCNNLLDGFKSLDQGTKIKDSLVELKATKEAEQMIKKTVDAFLNNDNSYAAIEAVNSSFIARNSMDANSLGKIFGEQTVSGINQLSVVNQEAAQFVQKTIAFDRQMKDLMPQIRKNSTKVGDATKSALEWLPFTIGKRAAKRFQARRDAKLTADQAVITMRAAIKEFVRQSDQVLVAIPKILDETHSKNMAVKAENAALKKVIATFEKWLEQNPSGDAETINRYQNTLKAFSSQLEIGETIYASNMMKINSLYTIFVQTQTATRNISTRGLLSVEELSTNISLIAAGQHVVNMNKATQDLINLAEESRKMVLVSLKAGQTSQAELETRVKEAAIQLGADSKELIQLTMDVMNGASKGHLFNKEVIAILQQVSDNLEKNEKALKIQTAGIKFSSQSGQR